MPSPIVCHERHAHVGVRAGERSRLGRADGNGGRVVIRSERPEGAGPDQPCAAWIRDHHAAGAWGDVGGEGGHDLRGIGPLEVRG